MILYVNACVRRDSRTKRLAECLLGKLDEPFTEVRLENIVFPVSNDETLTVFIPMNHAYVETTKTTAHSAHSKTRFLILLDCLLFHLASFILLIFD